MIKSALKISLLVGGIALSAAPAMALTFTFNSGVQVGGGLTGATGGLANTGNGVGNTHSSISGNGNGNTHASIHAVDVTKTFTAAPITGNTGPLTIDLSQ
jgi:hypothetical protein